MKGTVSKAWYIWITCCGVVGTLMFGFFAFAIISFFINGIQLVGAQPFSAFKQIIDSELAK